MPRHYRSGFERLQAVEPDKAKRYSVALSALRKMFTGFEDYNGYDSDYIDQLSESQQKQIRRYYNTLTEWTEGGNTYKIKKTELPKAIRDQGDKGIDKVKIAAGMGQRRGRAKFILVKIHGKKPRVKVSDDGSILFVDREFGIGKQFIQIHPLAITEYPDELLEELKIKTQGAQLYRVNIGSNHELGVTFTRIDDALKEIEKKSLKYKNWRDWINGINAYYSDKSIKTTVDYLISNKEAYKSKVTKARNKIKYQRRKANKQK